MLDTPPHPPHGLILSLHGYAMDAKTMLALTRILVGPGFAIAALQAPNQFYLQDKPGGDQVGYNWGTRNHGAANIALHHQMIRTVRQQLAADLSIGPDKTILVGYSQPVGFNYRFSATFPDEIRGVIGICGGIPKDWDAPSYLPVSASLLHIARSEDEFFPAAVTANYEQKLKSRAADVEFHLLSGGHRFPSQGASIAKPWLRRILESA